jgi:hypothetical protein
MNKRDADIEKHHRDIQEKDLKIYNTFIVSILKCLTNCQLKHYSIINY